MTICKVVDDMKSVVPDLGASGGVWSEWGAGRVTICFLLRPRISRSGDIKSPNARVSWCADCDCVRMMPPEFVSDDGIIITLLAGCPLLSAVCASWHYRNQSVIRFDPLAQTLSTAIW